MTDRELMQMALDALETRGEHHPRVYEAIKALRDRLAQPEREWVGLTDEEENDIYIKNLTTANNFVRAAEAKLKEKNT